MVQQSKIGNVTLTAGRPVSDSDGSNNSHSPPP